MSSEAKRILDSAVAENCLKLFADYRLEIRARGPEDPIGADRFLLCGIIGFTAKHMRGVVVLATTQEPLERTNHTSTTHRDWICELANQLLGRVKNHLLPRGIELHAATPVSLRGEHLSPVLQQSPVTELFLADSGIVGVWTDCEFDAGFAFSAVNSHDAAPVSEGEMLLF